MRMSDCESAGTYVNLDSTINDSCEDLVSECWAICRDTEHVPDVRCLCHLVLPFMWEVTNEDGLQC
jgi:hypothetical protein